MASREQQDAFFREMLANVVEPTAPFGLVHVRDTDERFDQAELEIEGSITQRIRACASAASVSEASLYHVAWALVLARVSGSTQILFGTVMPADGGTENAAAHVSGATEEVVPVVVAVDEVNVQATLQRVHDTLSALRRHGPPPLSLIQQFAPKQFASSVLNVRSAPAEGHGLSAATGGAATWRLQDDLGSPLALIAEHSSQSAVLTARVASELNAARICELLRTAVVALCDALEKSHADSTDAIDVLPAREREKILGWNALGVRFQSQNCIHELFEAQAERAPHAVAATFAGTDVTYEELNQRANVLAYELLEHGVEAGDLVGLCCERGISMLVGILSILKAGAAYVPLDPAYPEARLAYMVKDSGAALAVTDGSGKEALRQTGLQLRLIDVDSQSDAGLTQRKENLDRALTGASPEQLAYIIYTSGSTGQPKGVMVSHANVVRLFSATDEWFQFGAGDVWTLFHSVAFDFSVWEIWGALLKGGRLVVVPFAMSRSPASFYHLLCTEKVTVLNQTPSAFRQLIAVQARNAMRHSLRLVVLGGESLDASMLGPWYRHNESASPLVVNMYGITETTVHVTYRPLEPPDAERHSRASYIGRRIPDLRIYILDERGRLAPIGVTGEMYVGGAGVAWGYLGKPQLTAQRFLPDAYCDEPQSRIYRTGDLARWREDGQLEFVGRNDRQVKVRGFRIELGEIEAALREHFGYSGAAVVIKDATSADPRIVAYVETDEMAIDLRKIRRDLAQRLPEFMLPNMMIPLRSLPITEHGKLDYSKLPWPENDQEEPTSTSSASQSVTDQHAVTKELLEHFRGALGLEGLDATDDLFDAGATSLTLLELVDAIDQRFGVVVPVEVFLDAPNVDAIGRYVARESREVPHASQPSRHEERGTDLNSTTTAHFDSAEIDVLTEVLDYFRQELAVAALGPNDDLFDAGATSLTLIQAADTIEQRFGVAVPVEVFLDTPSVAGLARFLERVRKPLHVSSAGEHRQVPSERSERSERRLPRSLRGARIKGEQRAARRASAKIRLEDVRFAAKYYSTGVPRRLREGQITFAALSRLLTSLGSLDVEGQPKYLYPSAGGLNAVQTYVYVKPGSVEGVPGGSYYFHPENLTLCFLGETAHVHRSAFSGSAASAFESGAVLIVLVAELRAITPIYGTLSVPVLMLETGYMTQMLLNRQAGYGLSLNPASKIDGEELKKCFALHPSHRVMRCLIGGLVEVEGETSTQIDSAAEPLRWSAATVEDSNESGPEGSLASTVTIEVSSDSLLTRSLSRATVCKVRDARLHLREVDQHAPTIQLVRTTPPEPEYRARSCRRVFESAPIAPGQFSGFLSLVRARRIEGSERYLYASAAGTQAVAVYVYLKEGAVHGMQQGFYRYDSSRHELDRMVPVRRRDIVSCFTPFNRKHFKRAAFCVFLFSPATAFLSERTTEEKSRLLMEAGHIGQLLMERQAEFDIGVCPIGTLRCGPIREALQLEPGMELLHAFIGGHSSHLLPADWQYLDEARRLLSSYAGPESATPQIAHRARDATDVAVVGMAGRFPGARTLEEFWDNLKAGKRSIDALPEARIALRSGDDHAVRAKAGYLEDIDCFDSLLFNIAPAEARALDPQERLMLEITWECLENAGYTPSTLTAGGRVGVFIGAMWNDYQILGAQGWKDGRQIQTGAVQASIANRISHFFGFTGPSMVINTSCSSAMTAIHLACECLRSGDCDAAIVGGVNLIAHSFHQGVLESIDFLSSTGECRPFSAKADGMVVGEGVAGLLLRRRSSAVASRDHVHGVIKGTATGHSGRTTRFGIPSVPAQVDLMTRLFATSGITVKSVNYVETAAAGSGVADAAEITAIRSVFQHRRKSPCLIGSVKANVGHLESAAAMAQIIKVLLQLQHREIVPTIGWEPLSPMVDLTSGELAIAERRIAWTGTPREEDAEPAPLRALVNVHGATGSTGYLLLEEMPLPDLRSSERPTSVIVPISSGTPSQLTEAVSRLLRHLSRRESPQVALSDVAHTLCIGRIPMKERLAFLVNDLSVLLQKMQQWLVGSEPLEGVYRGSCEGTSSRPFTTTADLREIASHWVNGASIDWYATLPREGRRVPLPTYPFAKVRHWLRDVPNRVAAAGAHVDVAPNEQTREAPAGDIDPALGKQIEFYLKSLFARVSEIALADIDVDAELERYGINSVMIRTLNGELKQAIPGLPATLFFQHRSIRAISEYLRRNHRDSCRSLLTRSTPSDRTRIHLGAPMERQDSGRAGEGAIQPPTQWKPDDVAIIGLAGRYPGASTLEAFWDNLRRGIDSVGEIPVERWSARDPYHPRNHPQGKQYSRWGGFLEDVDKFDPLFFNISPREAELLDPQERAFLQTAWHALEDAAYNKTSLQLSFAGKVGVFVGVMYMEYQLVGFAAGMPSATTHGSIANRVSYFLDLNGPSMAIDTMCSSSLTAIHLAVESIKRGECAAAIAGGVNLSIHPAKYLSLAHLTMSSATGRCRSFGKQGDGMVPGEGVGAVMLRPLRQAVAAGDHIYGVIRSTSINAGGKTNGYTVPNPKAQGALIAAALSRARVHPRMISYIEAHGTGTHLGDPIEIAGLAEAFGEQTSERQFCAVGSVKSNIGHSEAAAGIAGLTKVLLQLKHRHLVPSLHTEELNPNIAFDETPFYLQRQGGEWKRPVVNLDGRAIEVSRIAGVSSFGAGGANAHVVVEEYSDPAESLHWMRGTRSPVLVVVSAKGEDRLRESVTLLLERLRSETFSDDALPSIAYTLQVGREALETRAAFLVNSVDELSRQLGEFLAGRTETAGVYTGEVSRNQDTIAILNADDATTKLTQSWIAAGQYATVAQLWVRGLIVDWSMFYGARTPRRLSLPGYPFARERCWVPAAIDRVTLEPQSILQQADGLLHPLVHRNTSSLSKLRFTAKFTGDEFFLRDHIVAGRTLLPAVAQLEMVRVAVEHSIEEAIGHGEVGLRIHNVVWLRPIAVAEEAVSVHIGVEENDAGELEYEIYSGEHGVSSIEEDQARTVYSQGRVVLIDKANLEAETLDVLALQRQCERSLSVRECYERYKSDGIEYGASYQGLQSIELGRDTQGRAFVLAQVELPECVSQTRDQYVLHPSILDCALHAAIGFAWNDERSGVNRGANAGPSIPYALDTVEIFSACSGRAHAIVRRVDDGGSQPKLNVELCDERGRICVRLHGFVSRALSQGRGATVRPPLPFAESDSLTDTADHNEVEEVSFAPTWEVTGVSMEADCWPRPADLTAIVGGQPQHHEAIQHHCPNSIVLDLGEEEQIERVAARLETAGVLKHLFWVAPQAACPDVQDESLIEGQRAGALRCFRTIKGLLRAGYGSRELGLTVVTVGAQAVTCQEIIDPTHASLHGLIGSLAKEFPSWSIRLVDLPPSGPWPTEQMLRLPADQHGNAWAYRHGQWHRQHLIRCDLPRPTLAPFCQGGTVVVIGGAGGIGEAITEHLIRDYQAQVIWLGRRALNAQIQAKLSRLALLGPSPWYLQADATDRTALEEAYRNIKARHPTIRGVIHSAIVLADQSLSRMSEESFTASLRAKVDSSVRLAQVFRTEPLDFVLFFSSLQSFTKAAGQSNYAAGCTFIDAFAHQLGREWSSAVRIVNWGYWGRSGVVAAPEYHKRMRQLGLESIEPHEGAALTERLLSSPLRQAIYLKRTGVWQGVGLTEAKGLLTASAAPLPTVVRSLSEDSERTLVEDLEDANERDQIDELSRLVLLDQLSGLGLFDVADTTLAEWQQRIGVPKQYVRWLEESLRQLTACGYTSVEGERYRLADAIKLDATSNWARWNEGLVRWQRSMQHSARARVLNETLRALPEILTGRRQVTEVLFPNGTVDLVEGVFKHNARSDHFNAILADIAVTYMQERLQLDPAARLRILEIGAGTGGTSEEVLNRLTPHHDHIAEYCYSDVSEVFLLHAQSRYAARMPYLRTAIFNVEKPITASALKPDSYDLVIAANVLHATKSLRHTLRNAKAMLRGNGLLLLNEISEPDWLTHLTFGLLEGWWLYEDTVVRMPGCPGLYPQMWKSMLESEGFAAVHFPAHASHRYGQQIIVARSDGTIRLPLTLPSDGDAPLEPSRRTHHSGAREAQSPAPGLAETGELVQPASTLDRDHTAPVQTEALLAADIAKVIRQCVTSALKMAPERIQEEISFSEYGVDSIVAVGLIKQINDHYRIILATTVIFDYPTIKHLARYILQNHRDAVIASVRPSVTTQKAASAVEQSAVVSHDPLPRNGSAKRTFGRASPRHPELTKAAALPPERITLRSKYQRVLLSGPGGIEDIEIIEAPIAQLRDDEVRIAVRAFSLNFGDLLCVQGLYPTMPPYPFTPGFEVSGTVLETGAAVTSVREGDAVFALMEDMLGGQATMAICREGRIWRKPEELSFEEACSLPVVSLTMIDAFHKARLNSGERILIQTAAGATGLIAVQLAKHRGAQIYATAGSRDKLDYLGKMGVSHRINYREVDFEQEILRLTNGAGVDVVINTLPGDALQKGMNCLAPGGRYVEIAMTALKSARAVNLAVLNDNQSFYSIDLRKLARRNPEVITRHAQEMLELLERGVITPTLSAIIPFDRIQDAYRLLETRQNIGKVVVNIGTAQPVNRSPAIKRSADCPVPLEQSRHLEPIAIIGMSGRFGSVNTVEELWQCLSRGADLTQEVDRWDLAQHYSSSDPVCRRGSFIRGIDQFDASFFHISAIEATYMDPQQRLFLEEAWTALENAGYVGAAMAGCMCGIYVGAGVGDYAQLFEGEPPAQALWGNAGSLIPARLSYYLDLHGPAIAVDTACSSSLVAVHLACQALRAGEVKLALAGGVYLQCTPNFYIAANRAQMLSHSGRCHAFDERADGFVPGEGVGVVVLKRLQDALTDGDHIYGVIRGSGINQDGATNGITAPSALSQERLERQVYESFQINAQDITMVEAHGTGTKLGDPIEFQALTQAFKKDTDREQYCALGSIKTNIGHTTGAAGVAGLIKVLLALQHRHIPPSLNFKEGNSHINFANSPFYVNTKLRAWEVADGRKRCAAVSSFGFSGTNAHLVVEEAPERTRVPTPRPGYLMVLSAGSNQQLRQQAEQLIAHCQRNPSLECCDVSYTLLLARRHFNHRLACVVHALGDLPHVLGQWLESGRAPQLYVSELGETQIVEQPSLAAYGKRCIEQCARLGTSPEYVESLAVIAELYIQGYELDFSRLFTALRCSRVPLPTYPFARRRHWVEPEGLKQASPVPWKEPSELKVLAPRWEAVAKPAEAAWPLADSAVVVVGGTDRQQQVWLKRYPRARLLEMRAESSVPALTNAVEAFGKIDHVAWLCPEPQHGFLQGEELIRGQERGVIALYRLLKALLGAGYGMRPLEMSVVTYQAQRVSPGEKNDPTHASVHGLMGSVAKEYMNWKVRVVDVPCEPQLDLEDLLRLPAQPQGDVWANRYGEWYRQRLLPCELPEWVEPAPFRRAGVYVVIGGAGGIGEVFSEHLIRTHQAQLVWIGRRPEDELIQKKRDRLAEQGPKPLYLSVDARDGAALGAAYQQIKERFGQIHGLVHSAIVLADQTLGTMEEERFRSSLSAKVVTSARMAQVFSAERLDFALFFSSSQGFLKSAGQSNYAAGCTFVDAFAQRLAQEWSCPVKVMNWGYWGRVGVVSSVAYQQRMARQGIGSIEPAEGMVGLERLLSSSLDQMALIKGEAKGLLGAMSEEQIVVLPRTQ